MFSNSYTFEVDYLDSHFNHEWLSPADTQTQSTDCPACGGGMVPFTRTSSTDGKPVLEKSICVQCRFMHFTRMPSREWFHHYYKNTWDAGRTIPKTYRPGSNAYSRNLKLLRDYDIPPEAKIFDFGAGYGQFLTACQSQGYQNLFGVEASERRAMHCHSQLGLNVAFCTGEVITQNPGIAAAAPFDVVHSHNVFEHVADIAVCLDNVHRILKPNGLFMLRIPHFTDEHFINIAHALVHVRQFTLQSVSSLLSRHGFQIKQMNSEISVVASKTGNQPTPHIDREAARDFEDKLSRDFAVDWQSAATGRHMWFTLKPRDADAPVVAPDGPRGALDALTWSTKRLIMGAHKPDLPVFGETGSIANLFRARNLGTKICRRLFEFGKLELGGKISHRSCEENAAPLVDFRYRTRKAVVLIK